MEDFGYEIHKPKKELTICNKSMEGKCDEIDCDHLEPRFTEGLLGMTGNCARTSRAVKLVSADPKGDPNISFKLKRTKDGL